MQKSNFGILSFCFLLSMACETPVRVASVPASSDTTSHEASSPKSRDSIIIIGELVKDQLALAGIRSVDVSTGQAKEKGINLLLRMDADRLNVSYPSALRSYNPEGYYSIGTSNYVTIIGNSIAAIRHAVYNYLEQLGFRYLAPGKVWNVVPTLRSPFKSFQRLTQPAFEFRHFANGHGFNRSVVLQENFNAWYEANQLGGFFPVTIGHVYQKIVTNNKKAFQEHPEYFAGNVEKGNLPPTAKFNVANRNLVELVKKDAEFRIKEARRINQPDNMISMEPSDGGGFCTSPECLKIGNTSEQVFYLANEVAKHIQRDFPGVWVGSLAYNEHILPVRNKLENNVFVMVTNGFNRTSFTTTQLLRDWKKKVSKVGVYEYLSVYEWDNDLPGRANATRPEYLASLVRDYYNSGATAYNAETTMGWISKGPGQYLVTKLLWEPGLNADSVVNDFYNTAYGNAASLIKTLYSSWEKAPKGYLSDNLLADWLQLVDDASKKVTDASILARIDQLKIYMHYLVLYKQLKTKPGTDNMNAILIFANRTFETGAFSTFPTMVSLPRYSGYANLAFYNDTVKAWKKYDQPLSKNELDNLFRADRQAVKRIEGVRTFDQAENFKRNLVPEIPKVMKDVKPLAVFTGPTRFVIQVKKKGNANAIELKSGFTTRPLGERPVELKIYPYDQYQKTLQEADVVVSDTQWSINRTRHLSLASVLPGTYIVEVDDQYKGFNLAVKGDILYSVIMAPDRILETNTVLGMNRFYFYVPEGVGKVVVHKSKVVKLQSPTGRVVELIDNKDASYPVPISDKESGLWLVFYQGGKLFIEGVPPYLGIESDRILLPLDFTNEK